MGKEAKHSCALIMALEPFEIQDCLDTLGEDIVQHGLQSRENVTHQRIVHDHYSRLNKHRL